MRWLLYLALAAITGLSIAGVIIATASVSGHDDVQRIGSALKLQTNCARVTVQSPSSARIARRWAGLTVRSADVACAGPGPRMVYAKFIDRGRLAQATSTTLAAGGYCRLGDAIMLSSGGSGVSTLLSDMCQSMGGTLVLASPA